MVLNFCPPGVENGLLVVEDRKSDGFRIHAHHVVLVNDKLFPSQEGFMFPIVEASQHEFYHFVSASVFVNFLCSPKIKGDSELT